ncbi:MAG TPA: YncE family protein [Acidimicrobiales bacterium]|nr:YncE family protein [Acidimicrobiales bacterium]
MAQVRRRLRRTISPVVASCCLVGATGCIGLHHSTPTTTTIVKTPPHLIALVTMIGTGTSAGSGTTVDAIDLSTNPVKVRSITVGQFPDAVTITPDHSMAYVTNYTSGSVTPINLSTGKVGKAIAVGNGPAAIAIAPNGKTAYVTDAGTTPIGTTVTPVNLKTHKALTPITVGDGPQGIAITPDGTTAYVANAGAVVTGQPGSIGSTVTPIDLATKKALAPIKVGNAPISIAISGDGSTVFVGNANSLSVSPIQAGSSTAGVPVPVDGSPQAIATTSTRALVAGTSTAGGTLDSIDTGSATVSAKVALPKAPTAIAIAPGGAKAWVVASGVNELIPVDLASNKTIAGAVSLPGGPYSVALAEIPARHAIALTSPPVQKNRAKA